MHFLPQLPTLLAAADPSPGGLFDFLHTMKGSDFLGLMFVVFLATFLPLVFLRLAGIDRPWLTMTALLIFEGLAVVRIVVGSFYGLHRWGFLIAIMIVGSLFYLIRGRHLAAWSSQWPSSPSAPGPDGGGWTGTGSSCSSSSSSSCSSSGGGCGGGSGCGGCGGGGD